MDSGTCYAFSDADSIIAFPDIDCSDGDMLSVSTAERAEIYKVYNGRVFQVRKTVITPADIESGTVLHVWANNTGYFLDMNFVIIPATIFVVLLFTILYRWFIRLRG